MAASDGRAGGQNNVLSAVGCVCSTAGAMLLGADIPPVDGPAEDDWDGLLEDASDGSNPFVWDDDTFSCGPINFFLRGKNGGFSGTVPFFSKNERRSLRLVRNGYATGDILVGVDTAFCVDDPNDGCDVWEKDPPGCAFLADPPGCALLADQVDCIGV